MATIPTVCQCGKRFQANEKLAGKRVRCPTCGAAIDVPAAPNAADPFGLSGPLPPLGVDTLATAASQTNFSNSQGYAPPPNYGQQRAAPRNNTNTALIVGIIAGVVGIGLVLVIGVALLLPAVQAAREAARRQAAKGNNAPGQANPGAPSPANWQTYQSPAGRYSVLMPRNVQTRTQSEPTAVGIVTAHMAIADSGANGAYFVAYNDLPVTPNPISTDELLDGACSGAVSRVRGQEVRRETITFVGHPGRDLTFEGNQAGRQFRTRTKIFVAGRRLYQVMWLGPAGSEPADLPKFFDSFQLTSVAETPAPAIGAGQPSTGAPPDEPKRRVIYSQVVAFRRPIETITQQRDRVAAQGFNTAALDTQIENLKNTEATHMQTICVRHRITKEQLDEIIAEGDANNWGNR